MKLVYTEQSLASLQETYDFLTSRDNFPKSKAELVINQVIGRAEELVDFPELGQEEELLSHLNMGHRRLIEGHIKVIYRIEGEFVYITDFFDSRQDPSKMKP